MLLTPESALGYRALAGGFFNSGEFAGAISAWREVMRRDSSPDAFLRIGESLLMLARHEEAATILELAVEMTPGDHAAWKLLGDARALTGGMADAAEAAWKRALEIAEEQRGTRVDAAERAASIAYYCAALGRRDCALDGVDRALSAGPLTPAAHYLVASTEIRLGNLAAARRGAELALRSGYPLALLVADPRLAPLRDDLRVAEGLPIGQAAPVRSRLLAASRR